MDIWDTEWDDVYLPSQSPVRDSRDIDGHPSFTTPKKVQFVEEPMVTDDPKTPTMSQIENPPKTPTKKKQNKSPSKKYLRHFPIFDRKRIRDVSLTPRKPAKTQKTSPSTFSAHKRTLLQACNLKEIPNIDDYEKFPEKSPSFAFKLMSNITPEKIWKNGLHAGGVYRVHTIENNDISMK